MATSNGQVQWKIPLCVLAPQQLPVCTDSLLGLGEAPRLRCLMEVSVINLGVNVINGSGTMLEISTGLWSAELLGTRHPHVTDQSIHLNVGDDVPRDESGGSGSRGGYEHQW